MWRCYSLVPDTQDFHTFTFHTFTIPQMDIFHRHGSTRLHHNSHFL